jgi:FRG domain-containing protein
MVEKYKIPRKVVTSLADYLRHIEEFDSDSNPPVLFRGQREDKPLVPRIARIKLKVRDLLKAEAAMFGQFKRRARPLLEFPPEDDWDWLAIAQHHGMATRPLDWTLNPLAALWFAVEKPSEANKPGVVWVIIAPDIKLIRVGNSESPFEVTNTKVFEPRHISKRIIAQAGCFTVHLYNPGKGFVPLEMNAAYRHNVSKIEIPASEFASIRADLDRCGFNTGSMYPDMQGLCSHIQWQHSLVSDETE